MIFDLYLQGNSIVGIIKELENRGIKTPTGKDTWSKRTIDVMLSNEKYIGVVRLLDKGIMRYTMYLKITIHLLFLRKSFRLCGGKEKEK